MCITLFLLLTAVVCYSESANILYVVPFTSNSHYIMLSPIGLELASRGHNVTVITPFREKDPPPNYHQVMVEDKKIWEVGGGQRPNVFTMVDLTVEEFQNKILWDGGHAIAQVALNSPEVKQFLSKDHKFDLVISEHFFQEVFNILAYKYNAPLIVVTTFGNCMRHNIVMRNPLQLATVVSEFLVIKETTSFLGRLRNWYFAVYEYFWWRVWFLPKNEELVKKYIPGLPEPVPSLYEMQKNVALTLYNSHFSFDPPTAYLPNVVEIGGIHLTKSVAELPKRRQEKRLEDNALDTAMFWIEYVIRHKGADFMKNPALELSWFASSMLDVYVFVFVLVATQVYFFTRLIKIVLRLIRLSGKSKKAEEKKRL